jgi:thiamine kinase-like enzyme
MPDRLSLRPDALAFVCQALQTTPADITDVIAVKKGMTNHSFLLTCGGVRYILRVPGEGTAQLIARAQEAACYDVVRTTGICDDIRAMDPATGFKLTVYWPDTRVCDPDAADDVARCMALLRRFHGLGLQVDHTFDLFDSLQRYEDLWNGAPSRYPDYAATKAAVLALRPYLDAQPKVWTLTHVDAVPDNFLFVTEDGRERLHLIDWEYAGMQDAHVDIAMFAVYAGYDRARLDQLIDAYFPEGCLPAVRKKIYCYVAVCGLLWSNWCEYKAQLGVEFGDYARLQYQYAVDFPALAAALDGRKEELAS